jgi:hypothetical protein
MPHLEPTYLRFIYDGLIKGSIHPENAAELPEGLIGLYEEAFDEKQPVHIRQQLLERFAIWALLKKEVTAQFIAEVLNQSEEEIQEFIATYSAWFNSTESGKYQLYHERLKIYLLQKLSEGEVHMLHEKLIERLEKALEEQKADEFEWYGLEFLGYHYSIESKSTKDSKIASDIFNLFYEFQSSKKILKRQQKLANSYKWSKVNLHLLSELGIIFKSFKIFNISDIACEIHKEEYDIIEKLEKILNDGNYNHAIDLVSELQADELELIEIKIYHILFVLFSCEDENGINNVVLILEDLLSKNAGELFDFEEDILRNVGEPATLIFSICTKLERFGFSSDFVIQSCNDWESREFFSDSSKNLMENRSIIDGLKSLIIKRNSDFYSLDIEFEKSEKFIDHDNNLNTLKLLESLQNFNDEAEVFHYFIANKGEFNYVNAYALVNCFQSFKSQNLKDILVDKFWEILILDLDLIDWIFAISNSITLNRLTFSKSEVLYEISLISQSPKILDSCRTIIEIRNQKDCIKELDISFCSKFDSSFEFKFLCLKSILNAEQIKDCLKLKYCYFKELFESNIETDILNYNIDILEEFVAFCTFCKQNYSELIDELITCFVKNLGHYEKWQFDENLFFLIDEMNKKNLSIEAYKILDVMETLLIQKVTLMKSFANWTFFNNHSLSFKSENLAFIKNEHRQYVILGWLKDGYGSVSFDLNVGNELPYVPDSLINESLFLENQIFVIGRPDILKIFSLKIIKEENNTEKMKSFFPFIYSAQENSN